MLTCHFLRELVLVHFMHGAWQSVPLPSILPQPGIFEQVRMVSADEGWFIYDSLKQGQRGSFLVHYVRGVWQMAANTQPLSMMQVTAVAPDDCLVLERNPDQTSVIAHFHQGIWTNWQPPANVTMTGVLLVTPTEGFALGYTLANDASVQSSYLAHFDGSTWRAVAGPTIEGQYQSLNDLAGVPGQIWIVGSAISTQMPPIVWQGTPGAWHAFTVPASGAPANSNGQITLLDPIAPTDAWAIVNQQIQLTSTMSSLRGVLWHYQNGQWVNVEG
jgi:hypothetical protein